MVKRKVDNRVRVLIENGVAKGYRTLFVIVGDKSRDQVVHLHHMLSKQSLKQANVLWCYKKELTFSSHRKKRMKQLKARVQAGQSFNEDDPFEMFASMTEIRYTYYKETHKILGNTFKMCVIQDFEAMSPNLLCRTIETVEGGGVICILLQSMTSLKQLFTLNMDVHARFRTEAHQIVVPRFNERFILSLSSCPACIVIDDQLRILPISSSMRELQPILPSINPNVEELKVLKETVKDTPPIGILVGLCKTLDQARVVLQFIMCITEKSLDSTVTLTAARGRGKSAAMGIALASAISFGYSNIFVTSPSPENLKTFFEFVLKGLLALNYEEHSHFQVIRSGNLAHNKAVMKIVINRDHQQVIQYISPAEKDCLGQAELVIIDEAAAIPLPMVQSLLGPYLVFMASTVSGYEGTGRSLTLKLIQKLRNESNSAVVEEKSKSRGKKTSARKLVELSLSESIRYSPGDFVEKWLHELLCLDATVPAIPESVDSPEECKLFYVNRDTLFGYHPVSEDFLSSCMCLLVSSHYRNSPDDLQTLSDAPAHHLFALTSRAKADEKFPFVICVIQVCFEGKLSKSSYKMGNRNPGDMIPWTVGNLFQDDNFTKLSGLRIVRIATHPELQGRGYGSRAIKVLEEYYKKASIGIDCEITTKYATGVKLVADEEVTLLEETLLPRPPILPLLTSLKDRPAEKIDYIGVSYGVSPELLTFWKRAGFSCIYVSQVSNHLTGENTAIMIKSFGNISEESWLENFWFDFRLRTIRLLSGALRKFECKLALSLLINKVYKRKPKIPSYKELHLCWNERDQHRLEEFTRNRVDVAFIVDILPRISALYFSGKIPGCKLKALQMAVLCGIGLQRKDAAVIADEFNISKAAVFEQISEMMRVLVKGMSEIWSKCKSEGNVEYSGEQEVEIAASVCRDLEKNNEDSKDENRPKISELVDASQFRIKGKENEVIVKKGTKRKKKLKLEPAEDKK